MRLAARDLTFEVRPGTVDDVPLLLSFIKSMAEFEKLQVDATQEILRESLFGEHPAAHTLLAFVDGRPAAYVVYFFSFSTMVGKRGLWLDDLFVSPEFRGKGIAKALMAFLADIAIQNHCGRFEWTVLDWNKRAIGLYKDLGADILREWLICRLDEAHLAQVASRPGTAQGDSR
jgi:GNAT superfamily N-acetyltransferase